MRIVFAITQSMESPYGVGRALPLAHALAATGDEVHIVALHHDLANAPHRHYIDGEVHIHYVGQMHVRKVGDDTLYFGLLDLLRVLLAATLAMTRALIQLRPDLIHLGKPHPQNVVAGLIASRLPRRPLILDYDDLEAESNRTSGKWQRTLLDWMERLAPPIVDGVTVHSSFLRNRLLASGVDPDRIHTLPSAVELQRFAAPDAAAVANWRQRLPTNAPIVLYVGTLSLANHPVHLLLAAFAILRTRVPDAQLVIAGGGKDIDFLRALAKGYAIADSTHFLGRVPAAEIPALYAFAHLTVDPVFDDNTARARWPLKIIESLAAGVPVATGNVGERRAMLADQTGAIAGATVQPGNAHALAEAMHALLSKTPDEYATLNKLCHTIALRYRADTVAAHLRTWYLAFATRSEKGAQ